MLFGELSVRKQLSAYIPFTSTYEPTHRSNLDLVPLKVVLRQGGQEEDDLSFDNVMNVRVGGIVHGWSPGPGRSLCRAPTWTTTSKSRF